jgi:ribonucleoside-diphosphate reductase beta chain
MESIHSRSYTYIVKNLYPNPTAVFDTILETKEIISRADSVTKDYDDFIDYAKKWSLGKRKIRPKNSIGRSQYELKKRFYKMLISINILEGIRFYVSFACSFGFGELRLMEGSAKIISLIARDESQHLAITQHIIKNYQKTEKDKQMLKVMKDCKQEVYDMYADAVEEEKEWAKYLMKDGSMIGLSATLLGNYVEFIANKRLRGIGLEPLYDISSRTNPLPWTQHWLSSRGLQNAPQETEIESYIIGGIKQDITNETFEKFKL